MLEAKPLRQGQKTLAKFDGHDLPRDENSSALEVDDFEFEESILQPTLARILGRGSQSCSHLYSTLPVPSHSAVL
jgi:hypothetical protein